jgi:hypothetical protein
MYQPLSRTGEVRSDPRYWAFLVRFRLIFVAQGLAFLGAFFMLRPQGQFSIMLITWLVGVVFGIPGIIDLLVTLRRIRLDLGGPGNWWVRSDVEGVMADFYRRRPR